ncbi:MAG: hypothetical protein QN178_00380 [Armatimonadota bacterium]|nr:hypothetical protein [Armatimonadota bacterium]
MRGICRSGSGVALGLVLVLALTAFAAAAPGPKGPKGLKPAKVKIHERGDLFCPSAALVYGSVTVQPRCYVLAVTREPGGTFLAFLSPEAKIPPGQLVRMNTPAGAKLRGRIFYLVPIQPSVVIVPVNTVMLIGIRVEDYGSRMSLTVIGTSAPNLTVIFNVRL